MSSNGLNRSKEYTHTHTQEKLWATPICKTAGRWWRIYSQLAFIRNCAHARKSMFPQRTACRCSMQRLYRSHKMTAGRVHVAFATHTHTKKTHFCCSYSSSLTLLSRPLVFQGVNQLLQEKGGLQRITRMPARAWLYGYTFPDTSMRQMFSHAPCACVMVISRFMPHNNRVLARQHRPAPPTTNVADSISRFESPPQSAHR